MRRVLWFLRALPLRAKLQQTVLLLILAYNFTMIDMNPANRLFGSPLWMTTVPIIVAMIVLARLLLPLMMAHPQRTQQFLQALGLIVFGAWLLGKNQWWGQMVVTYLGLIGGLWLEAAASFWFVSEIQWRQELALAALTEVMENIEPAPTDEAEGDDDVEDRDNWDDDSKNSSKS